MVYAGAARKTGMFMVIAGVISMGLLVVIDQPLTQTPTARAIDPLGIAGQNWPALALGIFLGGLMIGTYFYVAHLESRRDE